MKKWLLGLIVVLAVSVSSIYVFIPKQLLVLKEAVIRCNKNAAYRMLSKEDNWISWWPSEDSATREHSNGKPKEFNYENYSYQVIENLPDVIFVQIKNQNFEHKSTILVSSISADSCKISWQCILNGSMNPVKRIRQYRDAVNIKRNMDQLIFRMQTVFGETENLYKVNIEETMVKDSFLVYTNKNFTRYPSVQSIYEIVKKLQAYIKSKGASETNYPMLNILKLDSNRFETRVAIPVNLQLKDEKEFFFKRLVPGSILVAEIKGGPFKISQAENQMTTYINDYHKTIAAIPFESLVTDRLNEKDTSVWLTKLFYPVMQ